MGENFESYHFRCNICAAENSLPWEAFGRESGKCRNCGCWVRLRAVINALLYGIFGEGGCLANLPVRKDIQGLGLSDYIGYSRWLEKKFSYTNTFFHQEPKLDIAAPWRRWFGKYDFLIASDVFEHVEPPVERAFQGALQLLKPGGVFVLTVPFTEGEKTLEHFPELYSWRLVEEGGQRILVNRTRDGRWQRFENLVFHGGDGTTLEFRLFCLADLLSHLKQAGFVQVQVLRDDVAAYGILRQTRFSVPILARKPKQAPRVGNAQTE